MSENEKYKNENWKWTSMKSLLNIELRNSIKFKFPSFSKTVGDALVFGTFVTCYQVIA